MELLSQIQTQAQGVAKQVTAPGSTLWEQPSSVAEIKVLLDDLNDDKVLDGLRRLMAVRPSPYLLPLHLPLPCPPFFTSPGFKSL